MENIVEEPALKYNYISEQQYLEQERAGTEKHDYYQGKIFAMSGASLKHNSIQMNMAEQLNSKLRGKNCKAFGKDLRIHIPKNTLYTYPDFSVICGDIILTDTDYLDAATTPSVIIEILSKSTRDYDRGSKFTMYRDIATLQEYILIDSLSVAIEMFCKNENDVWELHEYKSIADVLVSKALKLSIQLSDIYDGLNF